ncbi:MAG: hypothetical protein K2W96_18325 [Gemmataceae bacterium]|nr:hypothetical protein [Gemmataceae bacterium]
MAAPAKKPAPAKAAKPAKAKGGGKSGGPNFFVQHGEMVGLWGAGFLCALILVMSLWSGFSAGSPDEKAKELNTKSASVDDRLRDTRNNVPGEADKPPKDSDKKKIELDTDKVLAAKYALGEITPLQPGGTLGRRPPTVFALAEGLAAVARVQVKTYLLTKKGDKDAVVMLVGGTGGAKGPGAAAFMGPAVGAGAIGKAGGMRGTGLGMPGKAPPAEEGKKDKTEVSVVLDDKFGANSSNKSYAVQIRPKRLAMLALSFPYKKQVEEFRARLGLRTPSDVLAEPSQEKIQEGKNRGKLAGGNAFRFLGVVVERRELDGDGKPATDWKELNLAASYREYLRHAGREIEEEKGDLAKVMFPNLVWPKLKQFRPEDHGGVAAGSGYSMMSMMPPGGGGMRGGMRYPGMRMPPGAGGGDGPATVEAKVTPSQYPPLETSLETIAETLKKLEGKKPEEIGQPSTKFGGGDEIDPLNLGAAPKPKDGGDGKEETPPAPGSELPEYCLVRILDVEIEPGKAYEYRMKVRMANPNADRVDVANPAYAEPRFLESPWSEMPLRVAVTPELLYYAVDQREIDKKKGGPAVPANSLPMQAHRWLTDVDLSTGGKLIIGDWAVAERILVPRGEYVGKNERIEMPAWRYALEEFVLADEGSRKKTIPVPFGFADAKGRLLPTQAILVDFERDKRGYRRAEAKDVPDSAAPVALLLNPDGKLVLREGAYDLDDKERAQRVADFRKRVSEVKKKGGKPGKGGFDTPGGPK